MVYEYPFKYVGAFIHFVTFLNLGFFFKYKFALYYTFPSLSLIDQYRADVLFTVLVYCMFRKMLECIYLHYVNYRINM